MVVVEQFLQLLADALPQLVGRRAGDGWRSAGGHGRHQDRRGVAAELQVAPLDQRAAGQQGGG
ncbi:hypothetical protein D3C78_1647740 [compost metagenome]